MGRVDNVVRKCSRVDVSDKHKSKSNKSAGEMGMHDGSTTIVERSCKIR